MTKLMYEPSKTFEAVKIPDTIYAAKVIAYREFEGAFGPALAIDFEIISEAEKGKVVPGFTTTNFRPSTKLGKWVQNMGFVLETNVEFDLDKMIGAVCRILTEKREVTDAEGIQQMKSFVKEVLVKE